MQLTHSFSLIKLLSSLSIKVRMNNDVTFERERTGSKKNKVFIFGIIRKKPSDNDVNSEDNHYLCLNSKTQICI